MRALHIERGIVPLASVPACRALLGAAAFSWWRPFPVPIYVFEDRGRPSGPFVLESLAHAVTELAGRAGDAGDRIFEHRRGDAYEGPEPFLFSNVVPPLERARPSREWRQYLRNIVDAMRNSQRPENVPEISQRIRLSIATGAQPLPRDVDASFYSIKMPARAFEIDWFAVNAVKPGRLLLGEELRSWIGARQDPAFFDSLEGLEPAPRDAAALGEEILNRFLAAKGLDPLGDEVALDRIRQRSASRDRVRAAAEPGLVTLTRDVLRDAVATGRARIEPGGSGPLVVGRLTEDRLYLRSSKARDLVLASGHTTASGAVFTRSLAEEGWITRAADGAWTVPRRINGQMTRVWDLPASFLGDVSRALEEMPIDAPLLLRVGAKFRLPNGQRSFDVVDGLAERVRRELSGALREGRARVTSEGGGIPLGRISDGRLYLLPAAVREVLADEGAAPPTISISRALGAAGWIDQAADGAWTVPYRIAGASRRVWNLPASFLDEGSPQRAL